MIKTLKDKLPKRVSPVTLAIALALVLVIWLLSGEQRSARSEPPQPQVTPGQVVHSVAAEWLQAEPYPRVLVLQGQVLSWQQVSVQAQVAGRVEQLLVRQGDSVAAGDVLLQLSDEGRVQQRRQAEAEYRLRKSELDSARAMGAPKFVSETELTRLESELARAAAELEAAELAVQYSKPKAPFDGMVDRRRVEIGEFVQPGTELMMLVQVQRLKVTAQIPQQDVGQVVAGQAVDLTLLDGRQLQGTVSFVSVAADPETRSFYVEVEAANPERWRVAGGSVTLHIHLPEVQAHRLSPALLRLNAEGHLTIRAVDGDNRVVSYPVKVVAIDNEAATVTGLPERVQVITQGAGFVTPGQQVQVHGAAQ